MKTGDDTVKYYVRQLDDMPWRTLFGYAWGAFSTSVLLLFVLPASWRPAVKAFGLALPLFLFVAKDLVQLPQVIGTLRGLRAHRAGLVAHIAACLPPAFLGMARVDRLMWRGFYGWLRRAPGAPRPDGIRLRFDQRSAYSAALGFALVSLLVELPVVAAILPLIIRDAAKVHTSHVLAGLSTAYGLIWLLGDRWLMRDGHHVLTETGLDLQIGARASAHIPLAAIEDACLLSEPPEQWRRKNVLRHADIVCITPFDRPNLVLRLAPGGGSTIIHHAQVRVGVRYLFLYLDHPEQLLTVLNRRIKDMQFSVERK